MSKDLKLKHRCPHRIIEEWLAIEDDRQTLRTLRDPSSKQIEVKVNKIPVPKKGLGSQAAITGKLPQPFTIIAGNNDSFIVSLNGEPDITLALPPGPRQGAASIVNFLKANLPDKVLVSEDLGRIVLTTRDAGPNASIFLKNGTTHATLGFRTNRFYRGRTVIPSWNVYKDEQRPLDERAQKIVFAKPFRSDDDIFELSYFTRAEDCRRCQGLRIEDDIRYDDHGEPIFVRNLDLLVQEVQKIIFTIKGSNIFHTWYGTSILDLVGSKIIGGGSILESQLVNEIGNALQNYRDIKLQQQQTVPVTDEEFLLRVTQLEVIQDPQDPTIFDIQIGLRSRANQIETLTDTIIVTGATVFNGFQFVG